MNKYKQAFNNYQVDSSMLKSNTNHRCGSTTKNDESLLQELVELATPKKVIRGHQDTCPKCGNHTYYENQPYCVGCSQSLDWSKK